MKIVLKSRVQKFRVGKHGSEVGLKGVRVSIKREYRDNQNLSRVI